MHRKTIMKAAGLIVVVLLIVLTIKSIAEVYQHELPMHGVHEALCQQEALERQSPGDSVSANMMLLECELRYAIAQPFIDQMRDLENAGRYQEALDLCAQAVQVLDGWDREGLVSYDCGALEYRIKCTVTGEVVHCLP